MKNEPKDPLVIMVYMDDQNNPTQCTFNKDQFNFSKVFSIPSMISNVEVVSGKIVCLTHDERSYCLECNENFIYMADWKEDHGEIIILEKISDFLLTDTKR